MVLEYFDTDVSDSQAVDTENDEIK